MKKILATIVCILLLMTALPVSAASATAKIAANKTTYTVGDTVTLTVTVSSATNVASLDASMQYDASVLEYVSAKSVTASGGAGVLKFSWYATAQPNSKNLSFTVTFKAKKAGSSKVSLSTAEVCDWDLNDLGTPSASATVQVKNPSLSSNANLTELYISSGTLSPAFSSNVTSYNIVLPNNVTVLTVSAETADKNASVTVEGSKNMQVGKNVRKVIVTAPDGTKKTYTLNITRQEATGNVTPQTGTTTTGKTQPSKADAQVTVGDEVLYIAKDFGNDLLPQGYEKTSITVNDAAYACAQDKSRSVALLYLTDQDGKNGKFYMYDAASMTFSNFAHVTAPSGVYVFLTPDATLTLPDGCTQSFIQIKEHTVAVWQFADTTQSEFCLVYALSPAGNKGLYRYDTVEGTMQRYVLPATDTTDATDAPTDDEPLTEQTLWTKIKATYNNLAEKLGTTRLIIIAAGSVLLLAAVIVLIVLLAKRPRDCKH